MVSFCSASLHKPVNPQLHHEPELSGPVFERYLCCFLSVFAEIKNTLSNTGREGIFSMTIPELFPGKGINLFLAFFQRFGIVHLVSAAPQFLGKYFLQET